MPTMIERKCKNKECRGKFMARSADVQRGWAKYCSKSCKARHQTRRTGYAGPATGRHHLCDPAGTFRNAHQFSNESWLADKDY